MGPQSKDEQQKNGNLGFKLRAAYGAAETGIVAVEVFIQLYLLKFFTDFVGLRPELAGIALSVAVIIDAFADPTMGFISDASRFRLGKRLPYIFIGGLALALAFPILFHPPQIDSQLGKFLFLLASYTLVNLAMTTIAVPHAALGADLTTNPEVRTQLYGFRMLFGNLGLLFGLVIPGIILKISADIDRSVAWSRSTVIIAIIVFSAALITVISMRNRRDLLTNQTAPMTGLEIIREFVTAVSQALTSPVFLPLFMAFFVATVGRTINSALALFYYGITLGFPEETTILKILGLFLLVLTISIVFWVVIARRFGKKWPAFIGLFGLGFMTATTYAFFPRGRMEGPIAAAVIGGIFCASIVLLESLVADVVDFDAVRSRRKREGLFFGLWKMASKVARALGLALSGFALQWTGIQPGVTTASDETAFRIGILFGPGVGLFVMLGALIFALIPWSNAIHNKVLRILAHREAKFALKNSA